MDYQARPPGITLGQRGLGIFPCPGSTGWCCCATPDCHPVTGHVIYDAFTFDRVPILPQLCFGDEGNDVVNFVEFNRAAGANNVVIFAIGPLAKDSRVSLGDGMVQLFALVKKFNLVCQDTNSALADRDITPVDPLAAAKVHLDFVRLDQHTLVAI